MIDGGVGTPGLDFGRPRRLFAGITEQIIEISHDRILSGSRNVQFVLILRNRLQYQGGRFRLFPCFRACNFIVRHHFQKD